MKIHDTDPVTELDNQFIGETVRREAETEEPLYYLQVLKHGAKYYRDGPRTWSECETMYYEYLAEFPENEGFTICIERADH